MTEQDVCPKGGEHDYQLVGGQTVQKADGSYVYESKYRCSKCGGRYTIEEKAGD